MAEAPVTPAPTSGGLGSGERLEESRRAEARPVEDGAPASSPGRRPPLLVRLQDRLMANSQAVTRLAFAVIVVLVLVQVGWWLVFQERYLSQVTEERLAAWRADAVTATALLQAAGEPVAAALQERYPHLNLLDGEFRVSDAARNEFIANQRGYMRMFAAEAPLFVLAILLSLILIASTLRSERDLKRRQQNFMSAVTHEFKTPISTLRLLVETALMRPLPTEKSRDYLKRMASEIARLEHTSDQVLASARLEQAQEAQPLDPHDLGELTARAVERVRVGLEARGARIEVRLGRGALPVSADEDAFNVVISNLLENAVKYTPGEVKPVTIRVEARDELALLHVEDEGIGIAPGDEKRIFERFYRSGDEMTRQAPGMGLGLHLVRSTVEAMNGWVRCENRDDRPGARFTVVLPRRVSAAVGDGGAA